MINPINYINRYPAKMVGSLAESIVNDYAKDALSIFDPFCGSSTILEYGAKLGIQVSGCDINPFAFLLSEVKLKGFLSDRANGLCAEIIKAAKENSNIDKVNWSNINYWFTPKTLEKFERLRFQIQKHNLIESMEGKAILLSLAISIRKCSRADQRSPKPFISKQAVRDRRGKHYDPFIYIPLILNILGRTYKPKYEKSTIYLSDIFEYILLNKKKHSHIITSPPYINAQDYFRNHKLELYILEGLLPFNIERIRSNMIGRENNCNINNEIHGILRDNPKFRRIYPKLSIHNRNIINQYFSDMRNLLINVKKIILPKGKLIIICGDNLMNDQRIPTCELLNNIIVDTGFTLKDQFKDRIKNRMLPPSRLGHRGLIKNEVVSIFENNA